MLVADGVAPRDPRQARVETAGLRAVVVVEVEAVMRDRHAHRVRR